MSFTPEEEAMGDRLGTKYNGRAHNATSEPFGFDRGGNQAGVFVAALKDVAGWGRAVVRVVEQALSTMQTSAAALLAGMTAKIEEHTDLLDRLVRATEAARNGPVFSVNGMGGDVVIPAMAAVLPPIVTLPAPGSTASLQNGALTLAVAGFLPLYPKNQKSIQFQVSATAGFASTVFDSGAVAGAGLSAAVADAQTKFTANTSYYVRARQTDQDDFTSDWSAVTSFVFPRPPSARAMSAPASGATNVGAQNAPITLTAAAYSHPDGVAQAARRFELSTTSNFAVIITVPGTAGQASATIASPKDVLAANTLYRVRCVDTDANGLVTRGAATTFTTVEQFKPNVGDAYGGGFYIGETTENGTVYWNIVASKSGGQFYGSATANNNTLAGASSRTDGRQNTDKLRQQTGGSSGTIARCAALSIGGFSDWGAPAAGQYQLMRSVYNSLAMFRTGAEAFETDGVYTTSTEANASGLIACLISASSETSLSKADNSYVRAVRRVAAS